MDSHPDPESPGGSFRLSQTLSLNNMPINIDASAQLNGRVGNVLREFVPGLERRVPPSLHDHNAQPRLINPDDGQGPSPAESVVVDVVNDGEPTTENNNEDNQDHGHSHEANQRNTWSALAGLMEKSVVFFIILCAKSLYSHRLGFLVLIGLLSSFYHSSSTLKKQIALKDSRHQGYSKWLLVWVIIFLLANITLIYWVFDDQKLYKSLYFVLPNFRPNNIHIWNLLWIVGITDFTLKFAAIICKAVVAILPQSFVPFKKRGKYYMFIEEISQCYRSITPIIPWYFYLSNVDDGGEWFSIILFILYFICKGLILWNKAKDFFKALQKVRVDLTYGNCPTSDEMKIAGEACPICHDDFKGPIILACKHIFCEDCVSMWFDREKTCPLCRCEIADDPAWRDGSTNGFVYWF